MHELSTELGFDLVLRQTLRAAEMRLSQALVDMHGDSAQAHSHDPRGLKRTRQVARDDRFEPELRELRDESPRLFAASLVQRDVEMPLEALFGVPVRLSVTENVESLHSACMNG